MGASAKFLKVQSMRDRHEAAVPLSPKAAGSWRPGGFALRDAWFPVAHSSELHHEAILRLVHSRRYYIWREGKDIFAAAYHPIYSQPVADSIFTNERGFYPVIERYGHAWVWYGDVDNADPHLIPDIPFLARDRAQPNYARGVNYFHCTYELVLENILDLTHIDFVHGDYAGTSDSDEDSIRFETTSETVTMIRTIKGRPTSKYQKEVLGVTVPYQDMSAFTHVFIRSGVCFLHSHYSHAPGIPLMQSNTPESQSVTRANYVFGVQQTENEQFAREWPRTAPIIAAQDESVLRPQNSRYYGVEPRNDCSTRFDAAGLEYRKLHTALADRQRNGDFSYQADLSDGSNIAEILKIRRLEDA